MKQIVYIIAGLILISCQTHDKKIIKFKPDSIEIKVMGKFDSIDYELKQSKTLDNYIVNSKKITTDFLLITDDCGVFISPDSSEIKKMKEEYGEDDFYIVADDNIYYDNQASIFLDSLKIKSIYPIERYLKFIVDSDTISIDTKSKYKRGWLSILYSFNKKPEIINSIDIEFEYSKYKK
jgi:hypothetical protein